MPILVKSDMTWCVKDGITIERGVVFAVIFRLIVTHLRPYTVHTQNSADSAEAAHVLFASGSVQNDGMRYAECLATLRRVGTMTLRYPQRLLPQLSSLFLSEINLRNSPMTKLLAYRHALVVIY